MQLKDLQKNFIDAVLKGKKKNLLTEMKDIGADKEALIAIYSNNTFSFLSNALKLTFPATFNILGEDKFFEVAKEYIKQNPSRSGNLDDYGEGFGKELDASLEKRASLEPAQLRHMEKLENFAGAIKDLSNFEWLYHKSAIADKDEEFPLTKFSEVKPENYDSLRFSFQNSFNIFSSKEPVIKIWQENTGQPITANDEETKIILIRPNFEVEIYKMEAAEFIFIKELFNGKDLISAFVSAEKIDENFDMGTALSKNLRRNIFKHFYL